MSLFKFKTFRKDPNLSIDTFGTSVSRVGAQQLEFKRKKSVAGNEWVKVTNANSVVVPVEIIPNLGDPQHAQRIIYVLISSQCSTQN